MTISYMKNERLSDDQVRELLLAARVILGSVQAATINGQRALDAADRAVCIARDSLDPSVDVLEPLLAEVVEAAIAPREVTPPPRMVLSPTTDRKLTPFAKRFVRGNARRS